MLTVMNFENNPNSSLWLKARLTDKRLVWQSFRDLSINFNPSTAASSR